MVEAKIDTSSHLHKAAPTGRILRLAIKQCNLGLSLKILQTDPLLCNDVDSYSGNTALHIAAISGLSEIIPYLISINKDSASYIEKTNNKGLTPITLAQIHKHLYIAEMLKDMAHQLAAFKNLSEVVSLSYEDNNNELSIHPLADSLPVGYWPTQILTKDIKQTVCK